MGLSTDPIASRSCTHWVLTEDPWDGTTDLLSVGAHGAVDWRRWSLTFHLYTSELLNIWYNYTVAILKLAN